MILDDVFVNFDADRTKTACAVLRDFAKQGHQLLVFTCHEHVWRMFQELNVDTRRIPNRYSDVEEVAPTIEPPRIPQPEPVAEAPAPAPVEIEQTPEQPQLEMHDTAVEESYGASIEEPSEPAPTCVEVEYWWDRPAPAQTAGDVNEDDDVSPNGWLPEPVIHPQPW
jgi:hypothetical protein